MVLFMGTKPQTKTLSAIQCKVFFAFSYLILAFYQIMNGFSKNKKKEKKQKYQQRLFVFHFNDVMGIEKQW